MTERVSTNTVRQRIGDLLNRVALRHDEFIIERKGKPLAALVAVERLKQMQKFARLQALEMMEGHKSDLLDEQRAAELANEAVRWARKRSKPSVRKAKRASRRT